MASKATVYVVDDDAGVRDALSLLLTLHGYSVRSFAAGQLFLDSIDADRSGAYDGRLDFRLRYHVISTNARHNMVFPYYLREGTDVQI